MSSFADQIAQFTSSAVLTGDLIQDRILMLSAQVRSLALILENFYLRGRFTVDELNFAIQSIDTRTEIEKIHAEMDELLAKLDLSKNNAGFDC